MERKGQVASKIKPVFIARNIQTAYYIAVMLVCFSPLDSLRMSSSRWVIPRSSVSSSSLLSTRRLITSLIRSRAPNRFSMQQKEEKQQCESGKRFQGSNSVSESRGRITDIIQGCGVPQNPKACIFSRLHETNYSV